MKIKVIIERELAPESAEIIRSDSYDWGFVYLAQLQLGSEEEIEKFLEYLRAKLIERLKRAK
jgi:hypothetical protein